MREKIVVASPVRGEWMCPNTPGTRVPSHGTNRLGTRYAYDFTQVDWNRLGAPAYRSGVMQYLLSGLDLRDYYCYGEPVYSPCDGIVAAVADGWPENRKTKFFKDISYAYRMARRFDPAKDDIRSAAGNYTIVQCEDDVYAAVCHLQPGSLQADIGDQVRRGDMIGRVGSSGNSFGPHLHFQLMDSFDMTKANGIPCAFEKYEIFEDGKWKKVAEGIPTAKDRIRF